MGIPLKVLIVEDSEDDVLLILHELKNEGYDLIYERVDTYEAMSRALDEQKWDVILSDYQMPNFNGLDALKLVKEKTVDLPFIIVSGVISEELAIEAMKTGAHDFIIKSSLSRLAPAIKRELNEAKIREERREAIKALKESENLYRTIFENTGTAIVIINEDTKIAISNREVEKMFGYRKDELEGKSWTELVAKEEIDRLMEFHRLRRIDNDSVPRSYETKIIDKSGNVRYVYVNAALIPETKQTLVSLLDITDRIKTGEALRQSEERFRRLTESAPDIIYRYRLIPTSYFEYINPIVKAITGYTSEEFYDDPGLISKIIFPEDWAKIQKLFKNKTLFKKPISLRLLHKDGKVVWLEQINIPVYDEGKNIIAIEGIARDITKRKEMEDEITKRVKELEDFYDMAIGRELRMIDLKEEIERLKEELKKYKGI